MFYVVLSNVTFICCGRKFFPGVCDGIFFDEAEETGLTDGNGDLTSVGQLYFDYNEAALDAVRGWRLEAEEVSHRRLEMSPVRFRTEVPVQCYRCKVKVSIQC